MDCKFRWILLSISIKNSFWKKIIESDLRNFLLKFASNRHINKYYLDFDFPNEILTIYIEIRYKKYFFFKYLSQKLKQDFINSLPTVQANNGLIVSKPKNSRYNSNTVVKALEKKFDTYLRGPLSEMLFNSLNEKLLPMENVITILIYAHLEWLKSRIEICEEDSRTILLKGYGGYIWANEMLGKENEVPVNKIYEEHQHRLERIYNDVFSTSRPSGDFHLYLKRWTEACKEHLNNRNILFKDAPALEEISYYYIPYLINIQLGRNEGLKVLLFYCINRLIEKYSKESLNESIIT